MKGEIQIGDKVIATPHVGRFEVVAINQNIATIKLLARNADGPVECNYSFEAPISTLTLITHTNTLKNLVGVECIVQETKCLIVGIVKYSEIDGHIQEQINHTLFKVRALEGIFKDREFEIPGSFISNIHKLLPDE